MTCVSQCADLQVANRAAPRASLSCAERVVGLDNSITAKPLQHDVGFRQHPASNVAPTSRPRVRRRPVVGRKPRSNWNTRKHTNYQTRDTRQLQRVVEKLTTGYCDLTNQLLKNILHKIHKMSFNCEIMSHVTQRLYRVAQKNCDSNHCGSKMCQCLQHCQILANLNKNSFTTTQGSK